MHVLEVALFANLVMSPRKTLSSDTPTEKPAVQLPTAERSSAFWTLARILSAVPAVIRSAVRSMNDGGQGKAAYVLHRTGDGL